MAFDNPISTIKKSKTNNHETKVFAGRHMNLEGLEKLDPVQDAQLYYQYICNSNPSKSTLKYIYKFVKNYHPSIFHGLRLEDIKSIVKMLDDLAFKENAHINILKILKELIKKLQTSPHHLTFIHPIFAKHCLLAKTYSYAKDILSHDIEDFDDHVTVLDFLLYHYYGGMLAIGLKDYTKALTYFRRVISAPAKVTSAIMIESYKKYVLVSILLYGKKQPLPSYTDEAVNKKLSKLEQCKKYKELENLFSTVSSEMNMNVRRIKKLSTFKSKDNAGLVKQTTRSYIRKVIQKLTQTYVTMSFEEIAKEIGLTSENANEIVERHLLSMIENNEIFAYINHSNGGMVSFYDDPERYNSNDTMEKINDCIKTVSELSDKVLDYHRDIKKEHINDATKKMKEMKKNINKMVLNDDINDPSLFYSDRPILLDIDDGFNNSDDDNDIGF
jgi:COP9 signalosome complex subunit 3